MADNTGLLVVGVAAAGVGLYLWNKNKASAPVAPVAPSPAAPTTTGLGYSIPDNISDQVRGAWSAAGGSSPWDPTPFIQAGQRIVPLGNAVWQAVFQVWQPFFLSTGNWPSNKDMQTWIHTAINNFG